MHYYPHHVGDYQRDTAHLSLTEHGVYRLLMDQYYVTELPLPTDPAVLCHIIRATTQAEIDAVYHILESFFIHVPDQGWRHNGIDEALRHYAANRERAQKGGVASVAARRAKADPKPPKTPKAQKPPQSPKTTAIKPRAARVTSHPTPPPTTSASVARHPASATSHTPHSPPPATSPDHTIPAHSGLEPGQIQPQLTASSNLASTYGQPTKNQEPETNNQEPETTNHTPSPLPPASIDPSSQDQPQGSSPFSRRERGEMSEDLAKGKVEQEEEAPEPEALHAAEEKPARTNLLFHLQPRDIQHADAPLIKLQTRAANREPHTAPDPDPDPDRNHAPAPHHTTSNHLTDHPSSDAPLNTTSAPQEPDLVASELPAPTPPRDPHAPAYSPEFERYFFRYPRAENKPAAWAQWRRVQPNLTQILAALEWQCHLPQWRHENGRYIPSAANYLANRRWDDHPPIALTR